MKKPSSPSSAGLLTGSGSQPSLPTTVQRNRLTPRSAEACRRTGVEPTELLPLPKSAFAEPGRPDEAVHRCWAQYEEMRVQTYQRVRAERDRILSEGGDAPFVGDATEVAAGGNKGGETTAAKQLAEQSKQADSKAAQLEQAAIERIKKKQQAEIEQMLLFEIRSAQLAQEKADKLAAAQAADAREKAEKKQRAKEAAEARRQQEMQRAEDEKAADKEQRRRQRQEMEREARKKAEEEEAERQRLREMEKREKERAAKQAARVARQQAIFKQQQDAAYAKQEEEARREEERVRRLEEKQAKAAAELQESRDRAMRRIAMTQQMRDEKTMQMRNNYIQKLSAEEQRRADWNAAKQASIEARIRAGEEKAEHIKEVQQMMEMTLEARKNEIIGKEREHDSIKEKADAEREVKQRAEAAEKEMKQWTRRLQQARHQRKDEYRLSVLNAKISMEGKRTDDLLTRRKELLGRRKDMRAKSSLMRQNVNARLDDMRQSSSFDVDEEIREFIVNPELQVCAFAYYITACLF